MHSNVCEFLETIPDDRKLLIRAEDVLGSPDVTLSAIVEWLGLRNDLEALDAMKDPEARLTHVLARRKPAMATTRFSCASPAMPAPPAEPDNLDAPLSWREDGAGFRPDVKELARQFGYT